MDTTYLCKPRASLFTERRGGSGGGRSQHAHKVCKRFKMLQSGASPRPVITKRSCTEPSLTPLLFLNRASRIGPFGVMNHGSVFFAPFKWATSGRGFFAGLVPPISGLTIHDERYIV